MLIRVNDSVDVTRLLALALVGCRFRGRASIIMPCYVMGKGNDSGTLISFRIVRKSGKRMMMKAASKSTSISLRSAPSTSAEVLSCRQAEQTYLAPRAQTQLSLPFSLPVIVLQSQPQLPSTSGVSLSVDQVPSCHSKR